MAQIFSLNVSNLFPNKLLPSATGEAISEVSLFGLTNKSKMDTQGVGAL